MRIVCDACAAKYSIADDKLRGKVFKIRCKKCSNVIVVKAPAEAVPDVAAGPDAVPATEGASWHLVADGEQVGPFTVDEIGERVARGEASDETFAWCEGMAEWAPLAQVDAFATLFGAAPPATTESVDTHAQRLWGERNESSVLFSLGNLAQIAAGPAARSGHKGTETSKPAPSGAGGEGSGLIDIRSMASAYLGSGPLSAKPAARVGSIDDLPVFATTAFSEPAVLVPMPMRADSKKLVYVMGSAVAMLAVVAIVLLVVLLHGSLAQAQAHGPNPTPNWNPNPTPNPTPTPTPPPARNSSPPPATPHAVHHAPTLVEHPAQPAALATHDSHDSREACDDVFCVVNSDAACCHAHGAHPAHPTPTPAPVKVDPNLPEKLVPAMITSSLGPVRARVMACGSASSKGRVKVHVKVGADGRVTDATVDEAPDATLGACVAAAVHRATFPKTQIGGSFGVPYLF